MSIDVTYLGCQSFKEAEEINHILDAFNLACPEQEQVKLRELAKRELEDYTFYVIKVLAGADSTILNFGERAVKLPLRCWLHLEKILIESNQLSYWKIAVIDKDWIIVTASLRSWFNLARSLSYAYRNYCYDINIDPSIFEDEKVYLIHSTAKLMATLPSLFIEWPITQRIITHALHTAHWDYLIEASNPWHYKEVEKEELGKYYLNKYRFQITTDFYTATKIQAYPHLMSVQAYPHVSFNEAESCLCNSLQRHASASEFTDLVKFAYDVFYTKWVNKKNNPLSPEEAFTFMPLCLKTKLMICGYKGDAGDSTSLGINSLHNGFSSFVDLYAFDEEFGLSQVAARVGYELGMLTKSSINYDETTEDFVEKEDDDE